MLIDGELGIKGGWESGRRIAAQVKRGGIDGIFVVNDLTAVGVVNALLAGGVRIPADVSLVACDNLPFIDSLPVRLATVDIGLGRCHEEAVSQLLQTVRNGSRIHIPVRPRLQEGESVMRRR